MRVKVRRLVTHRCPFRDERDLGTLEASWLGDVVELGAFAEHLDTYADAAITHEDMTQRVRDWLERAGAFDVYVTTDWQTAGLEVRVHS